jgi:glucose dehydrogenase
VDLRDLRAQARKRRSSLVLPALPADLHDYDGVNENVLVDLPIAGRTRKVLLAPIATATCT